MTQVLASGHAFYVSYGALWVLLIVNAAGVLLLFRHFGLISMSSVEGIHGTACPSATERPRS